MIVIKDFFSRPEHEPTWVDAEFTFRPVAKPSQIQVFTRQENWGCCGQTVD